MIMILISQRTMTKAQLARRFGVGKRTIARDIKLIEGSLEIPVIVERNARYNDSEEFNEYEAGGVANTYRIDRFWASRFMKLKGL